MGPFYSQKPTLSIQGVSIMSLFGLFPRRPSVKRSRTRTRPRLLVEELENRNLLSSSIPHAVPGVVPMPQDNNPIVEFHDKAYFAATAPGGTDVELWKSNGKTATQVTHITNLIPNPTGSANPANLTVVDDYLFFTAT